MKNRLIFLFLLFISIPALPKELLNPTKESQQDLEPPGYGIITEEDLAIDAWRGIPYPVHSQKWTDEYVHWKCFPTREATLKIRTWRDADPMGFVNQIVTMCDLEIWIDHPNDFHIYSGRRGKEISYCREFKKAWKRLTAGERYFCFNGDHHGQWQPGKNDPPVPFQSWTWSQFKTHKGCYSYFIDECDLSYQKKFGNLDQKNSNASPTTKPKARQKLKLKQPSPDESPDVVPPSHTKPHAR